MSLEVPVSLRVILPPSMALSLASTKRWKGWLVKRQRYTAVSPRSVRSTDLKTVLVTMGEVLEDGEWVGMRLEVRNGVRE